jgi:hypothetical protein
MYALGVIYVYMKILPSVVEMIYTESSELLLPNKFQCSSSTTYSDDDSNLPCLLYISRFGNLKHTHTHRIKCIYIYICINF